MFAVAASAAGRKVAVVDLDLRAPVQQEAFTLSSRPGISAFVEHRAELRTLLVQDSHTGVWVLPTAVGDKCTRRLLHSTRIARLLELLRGEFDLVLLDTPPVLSISDARVLARLADHTVLVVCWSRTPWSVAKLALGMLLDAGIRVTGMVLNQVDVQRLTSLAVPEAEPYRAPYRKYYKALSTGPR
jgi:polysaccharide biosynthesis transport protein